LATGSKTLTIAADVTSAADTDAAFTQSLERFGHIDVVVNAFGAMNVAPVRVLDPAAWWQNFKVSVKAVFNASHSYIAATVGKGTIINLVSLAASFVAPAASGYSASKLAVIKLGECLDVEQPGLRVFSAHPGMFVAENGRGMVVEAFAPFTKDTAALTGGLIVYLSTPEADFLKGGYIHANWDVEELEQHKNEIVEKRLVDLAFLNGQLQMGSYPWSLS
jgi:NAD(P)-dependent dehydrogenase (short-subunit alcohol dehydrogenase family)